MDSFLYSTDKKTHIKILFLYRIGALFFASMLTLEGWIDGSLSGLDWMIIIAYGVFQLIVPLFFIPVILSKVFSLFAFADILIACLSACYTGGINSPLVICCFIPIFSIHFLYGTKGFIHGIIVLLTSCAGLFLASGRKLEVIWYEGVVFNMIFIALSIIVAYIIPGIVVRKYYYLSYLRKGLEERLEDMDVMNTRLLLLFEMIGKMSYEAGINQSMDKIHLVAKEVFNSKRACVYLVFGGELYSYGETTREEKAEIYSLIDDLSNKHVKTGYEGESRLEGTDDSIIVPIMSGTMLDGVLCLFELENKRITSRDAILITVVTNVISSYLRNLEYLESVSFHRDTSVKINQLDSGKAVKGVLDKRILSQHI